jgi:tetratricopeptide (TPR) repeat protein
MEKRLYLVILYLCTMAGVSEAGTVMFEEANKLYHNKQYKEAADLYMHIINDKLYSTSVFYNAGNAYYKCKKFGLAVWCYEKALLYDPENAIVQENLALTNQRLKNTGVTKGALFSLAWLNPLLHFHTLNKWCLGALLFYALYIALHIVRTFRRLPIVFMVLRKVFLGLFALYTIGAVSNYVFRKLYKHGVVVETVSAYASASEVKDSIITVKEGSLVQILAFEKKSPLGSGRYKVKLPTGKCTWVDATKVNPL